MGQWQKRERTWVSGQENNIALCGLSLAPANLSISDEVFSLFSELIYGKSGIRLGIQKKILLTSRLARRIAMLGIKGFYDYYQVVKTNEDELVEMLNCISTNTTKFFREAHHFEYLKNKVMPELLKTNASDKSIRIWSAGCSTGEEPYSIAITVHEAMKTILPSHIAGEGKWNIKILATDISTKAMDGAKTGIYEYQQLPDNMQTYIMSRYFMKGAKANDGKIMIKGFIKDMIRFRRLNFKESAYPFSKKFDVIFCRNVMIYFDENMRTHVINKFYEHLSDNGHLFLGHSETILNKERFIPVHITVHRKR
ncbi:MAG: protein-glutamate O-methyltransferase CheR [Deltaproteobacteria bacterium]|nr:protein-glutamate O-methyltransferase CheR [Deltaproteobacteria bacterium]